MNYLEIYTNLLLLGNRNRLYLSLPRPVTPINKCLIEFLQHKNFKRVCCLLPEAQLDLYTNLLGIYQQEFGIKHVCWASVKDFHLCDLETLTQKILPFLITADKQSEKVVVHCSADVGRTGHVLAAWLVSVRGFFNKEAIAAVKRTGRNPYEAVIASVFTQRNPFHIAKELNSLLNDCRLAYTASR